ncbi:TerC family protein [Aquibacillus rhizosphaerae]|uniref:TerC family protein n=1 Tax=Aquibacillus rhizosphaerae TaxID=3051431 RepID=A0ABT7L7R8_9BACI|nr:TerC family protein [Aquibacillus sp. LR5S19]MDL4841907.1 TerC family protein [Aquibacillus sp. LR5S19]
MDLLFSLGLTVTSAATISFLKIIAIDIILSGDNAVVIAMATKSLPKEHQNKAILFGTAGAVLLRILFAVIIVYLLQIPFVNLIGGMLLLWIAYNLLVEEEEQAHVTSHNGLFKAITTIIIADAVMSLDNVIAITGAAHGDIKMIAFGVMVSIPIMIFGSKIIVKALEKYRWISYIGSGILAWTAGEMIITDKKLIELLNLQHDSTNYLIIAIITVTNLIVGYAMNKSSSDDNFHKAS